MKDSEEVLIPSRDLVFIAFREDEPGERAPFTPLDDLHLDLGHGSTIWTSVSEFGLLNVRIGVLAYVVRSPMASRTV